MEGRETGKEQNISWGRKDCCVQREGRWRNYKRPKGQKQALANWYKWQTKGAYSHFEYVLLVSLWIVWMAIHFLSLKLVLARVDLRTKTASLNWLKFMEVSCGHLMLIYQYGASRRFLLMCQSNVHSHQGRGTDSTLLQPDKQNMF